MEERDDLVGLHMERNKLLLRPWSPAQDESVWPSEALVWIRLRGIPYHCWSSDILLYIAASIGKLLHLDETTAKQRLLSFARVLMQLDSARPSPRLLSVDLEGEGLVEVEVQYENIPGSKCLSAGHLSATCPFSMEPGLLKTPAQTTVLIAPSTSDDTGNAIRNNLPSFSRICPCPARPRSQRNRSMEYGYGSLPFSFVGAHLFLGTPGSKVFYLGAALGTTISHVSDIVGLMIFDAIEQVGGIYVVTNDHGNAEDMVKRNRKGEPLLDKDGNFQILTSHTLQPVPVAIGGPGLAPGVRFQKDVPNGGLANVAATVMNLHGFEAPSDYEPTLVEVVDS